MKAKKITYWITTVLISAMMAMSAGMYLTRNPMMMGKFAQLGYPAYFPTLLGVAKLLGICALLAPGLRVLKEWAYAGFTFTFVAAIVSHLSTNDAASAPGPGIALALLAASYFTRPESRRVSDLGAAPSSAQVNASSSRVTA